MSYDDPHAREPAPGDEDSIPAAPHPYSYLTIRLTAEEFEQVARAARAAGQTLPAFGRAVIIAAARAAGREQASPPFLVSTLRSLAPSHEGASVL
jgi:hypothetical protein